MASSSIPANPTSNNVAHLLPKLSDPDSDLRYMALNDLRQIFNTAHQTFLLHDYNTCARTVDGFCHTLNDTNGEVQNMTIQCLGPFVNRVPDTILCPLIDKVSNLQTDNTVDSSIPALALRAIVVALPRPVSGAARTKAVNDSYVAISRALIPRLVGYNVFPPKEKNLPAVPKGMLVDDMEKGTDSNAIDVLTEVARCFGPMLKDPEIQALQRTTLEVLESERSGSVLKKKAVAAVSTLANYFSDTLLSGFISRIIEKLRDEHLSKSKQKLYITIIGSMARANPRKVGPYLQTLTPFILNPLEADADEGMEENEERDSEIDEVQEAALVAIEGFLAACSRDMRMFTNEVINAAVKLLKYDPNNFMHDDEDMAEEEEDEELEGDDFEEEGGYDDDDDSSWKVRRCAAKVLYTLIMTRGKGELLDDGTLYTRVAPALVSRFKEREETVRLEVLATLIALVRLTSDRTDVPELSTSDDATRGIMLPPPSRKRRRGGSDASMLDGQTNASLKSGSALSETSAPATGARLELTKMSHEIVKGVAQLLKTGPLPTKQTSIVLLKNLVITQHGGLTDYLGQIVGPVVDAAKSSGSTGLSSASSAATGNTLRINALQLLGALAHSHSAGALQPYLEKIVPTLVKGAQDRYSKVSVESLSAIEQYILAMTPPRSTTTSFQAQLASLFDVLVGRISASDADLEVRQQAIHVLGLLLGRSSAVPGLLPADKRKTGLDLLQDRLKNELTRLATVRAIDVIGSLSKDKQDLQSPWVREVVVELSLQFRKASRALRGASLSALRSLAVNPSTRAHIDDKTMKALLEQLLPTLTSNDLHMLGPGLTILAAFVQENPKAVMTSDVVKALCFVVQSSVTGSSMEALLMLMRVIGQQGVGAELMQAFLKDVGVSGSTDIVGKVIGTLLVAGTSTLPVKLEDFINELNTAQDDKRKCLALSVLGEASLRLGASSPLTPDVFMSHFQSKSDQVPLAAANALGRAGAGNVQTYLPAILDTMSKPNSRKYLLLHAVKEILKQPGAEADIIPHANSLWQNVLAAAQADDNRAIGAECIGRLAIIDPKTYLPQLKVILRSSRAKPSTKKLTQLQQFLGDSQPNVRGMVISALRYTFADTDEAYDEYLKPVLTDMLTTMLKETDLENRRLALTTFNSAAHNKPDLILPHLEELLPMAFSETILKPELVREVQMGPFKHKVDDGLEIRKSAYECLYALMESAFNRLPLPELYDRISAGIADEHDIRILCNLMLSKLAVLAPEETKRRLDALAERFKAVLAVKPKDNAVKQEIEKIHDGWKGVLKVSALLNKLYGQEGSGAGSEDSQLQAWQAYYEGTRKEYPQMWKTVEDEMRDRDR